MKRIIRGIDWKVAAECAGEIIVYAGTLLMLTVLGVMMGG